MASVSYRGIVREGLVVLREGVQPPVDGTEVVVTPVSDPAGLPAAVLAAVEQSPPVPVEWVDELGRLIAQGHRPATRQDPFADDAGPRERP